MKKILFAALVFGAAHTPCSAQQTAQKVSANASQVYLELGGLGLAYTVNYDSRLTKQEDGPGFRVGIGALPFGDGNGGGYVAVPAQINYLLGKNGNFLELGAGASFISVSGLFQNVESGVVANTTIGYRKVSVGKKGLTWRIAFNPFIGDLVPNGGFYPWAGISIGYRF